MESTSPGTGRQADGNQTNQGSQSQQRSQEPSSDVGKGMRSSRPQSIERTSGNFSTTPWSSHPMDTMARISREMDQLIDSFFGGRFGLSNRPRSGNYASSELSEMWSPRIDVRQQGDNILISAELPGVQKDAVQIEATNDGIAISGERRDSREGREEQRGYRFAERSYGSFYRSIPLPEGAKAEEATASMRDGVLEITVPIKQTSQKRRIEISG